MMWKINGSLILSKNYLLKSLKGFPEEISGDLYIRGCISLDNLDHGLGKKILVGGIVECDDRFSEEDIKMYFDVKGRIYRQKTDLGLILHNCAFLSIAGGVARAIELGVDVNYRSDILNDTALMSASRKGNKEVVKILLEKGADVNLKDSSGYSALMFASTYSHEEIVKMLLEKGADVNAVDKDGSSALIFASQRENKEIVEMLLKAGAEVNVRSKSGMTALRIATIKGNEEVVELLKKYY